MRKFTLHGLVVVLAMLISAQAHAQDVIDLTTVDNPDILADTLPDLNSGSIVLLKPGMTYNAGGYAFDKSFKLQNSEPSNLNPQKINVSEQYIPSLSSTSKYQEAIPIIMWSIPMLRRPSGY